MNSNEDQILKNNTFFSYSEKRNSFIKILQDNPPAKNKKNPLYSYCIRATKKQIPEFLKDLDEKEKTMEFIDALIEFFNVKIKLDLAIEKYNNNKNTENYTAFTIAKDEYLTNIKSYNKKYKEIISQNNQYIKIHASLILFMKASFIALFISLLLGVGLFTLIPGLAIPLAFFMIGLIGDTKNYKYNHALNAASQTYNDTYKENIGLFSTDKSKVLSDDNTEFNKNSTLEIK